MRWGAGNIVGISCGLAALAVPLAAGISSATATAPRSQVRLGELPRIPPHAASLGRVAGPTRMHITVALKVRDPAAMAAYARAVSTPGSTAYREYLSPTQFGLRFGPTAAQVAAVRASLRAHGLNPGRPTANGLAIPINATAAQVERAFSVSLARVVLSQGRRAVVASAPPAIDARVAGEVQAVVGLTSVSARPLLDRPRLLRPSAAARLAAGTRPHVATGGPQPCPEASTAASGQGAYTADQIASAYHFSDLYAAGDQGQGQTIAVYELESNDPADIAATIRRVLEDTALRDELIERGRRRAASFSWAETATGTAAVYRELVEL